MRKIVSGFCCLLILGSASASAQDYLLSVKEMPSSLKLLPPPPGKNSVAFQADQAISKKEFLHHNQKRWVIAQKDADLSSTQALENRFQAALGFPISQQKTPAIYRILKEIMHGEVLVTRSAKQYYMRERPLVFFHTQSCLPKRDEALKKNGSYPSGHTTIGWATALVLAEINPTRENEILKRGYEYGQSRVVCGAHWQSDVDAGRVTGAILVARLQASKGFQRLIAQAKKEMVNE